MRNTLLVMILTLLMQQGFGQYTRYIVKFRNKSASGYQVGNPQQYLSTKALERRTRQKISIDSSDLPVAKAYIDSVVSKGNVTVLSTSRWLNQVLIKTADPTAINRIQQLPFVATATPIALRPSIVKDRDGKELPLGNNRAARRTADYYNYGQSYEQVHIHEGEYLHNLGFRGQNMIIAVLDAGFHQYKNIYLFDSIRNNGQVLGERDFVAFDNSTNEDDSHGRQVLGVLAANKSNEFVGTAPQAKYWLLRTEDAASEYPVEEHNWVVGAEFADSVGADIITSSLGYFDFDDPAFDYSYDDFYKNRAMVTQGAATAVRKGMIVTNSAGNEGNNGWKYIIFPADADSVCTVGATNTAGVIASFSSWGYPGKVKPNVVSVGLGTVVAGINGPALSNGTSFSNPNMAGLIACLWQAFPQLSNMTILNALYRSSDRYNNPDERYGFGIPNMRLAYQFLETEANKEIFKNNWLVAYPVPFNDELTVKLLSPETGTVALRLLDAAGRLMQAAELNVQQGLSYTVNMKATALAKGVYFIHYIGKEKATVKVAKF